jgi:hypothetical protein
MRTRLLAVALGAICVALLFAVLGMRSTASASGSGDPRIAVLQSQVKTLQAQVKALTKGLDNTNGYINTSYMAQTCLAAETADLFQSTWGVIDQIKPTFGPQTQVNDYGNCGELNPSVPRAGIAVPPTLTTGLVPLIKWLHE